MSNTQTHVPARRHGPGRIRVALAGALALTLAGATLAIPALAAVKDPRSIEVFHGRDFVGIDGFPAETQVRVDVLRGSPLVRVGTATATTDADGFAEVNHLGEGVDCWDPPASPDIMPGDVVQTTVLDGTGTDVDFTATRDIFVDTEDVVLDDAANTITLHGHARSRPDALIAPGSDTLELRLNKNNTANTWENSDPVGRRDFRDDIGADVQADGSWTHVITGVSEDDMTDVRRNGVAVGLEWSPGGAEEGAIPEITVYDGTETTPGCPPMRRDAVTESVPGVINVASQGQDLVLKGTSWDATSVTVTLDDGAGGGPAFTSDPITPTPASGSQTWQVTVPAAAVSALSDGTLTASSVHTVPDPSSTTGGTSTINGASLSIVKDTVAPGSPSATPPGGTYNGTQAVSLNPAAGEAVSIHWRLGPVGSTDAPAINSTTKYTGQQIQISADQTLNALAVDAAGNASALMSQTYDIVTATAPGAPTNVVATGGDRTATVTWSAPTNTGGAPITSYVVKANTAGASVPSQEVTGTSATFTGLVNGTQYTFDVSAKNIAGESPATRSNTVTPNAPPTVTVPGAPTGVTGVAGNAQATVSWTAPANTGGAPITSYSVEVRTGTTVVNTVTGVAGTATSTVVTGLTNGTAYNFRVQAHNSAGAGAWSTASAAVTPTAPVTATVPGAPTGVSAVPGNAQATVSWTPPANDGGSPLTEYRVQVRRGTTIVQTVSGLSGTATSTVVTGLTNGTAYNFRVRAFNAVGFSAWSTPSAAVTPSAGTTTLTVPDAPTGVSAVAGNAQATVSWTAPANTGGASITSYSVEVRRGTTIVTTVTGVAGTATSTVVTGLTNGTAYNFRVQAHNVVGAGAWSTASAAVTPTAPATLTVPGAPTGVSAVPGNAQATVRWTAPANTGGASITSYSVQVRRGSTIVTTVSGVAGTATSTVVTGLTNGTAYNFRVRAHNVVGAGAWSTASAAVTPTAGTTTQTVPGAPTGVSAVAGNAQATVRWTAPANTGGAPITSYSVQVRRGTTIVTTVTGVAGTATSTVVTGLTNGTAYNFRVRAHNSVGAGAWSSASAAVTPTAGTGTGTATVPGKPIIGTAVAGVSGGAITATANWSPPASDGGSPITAYRVFALRMSSTGSVVSTTVSAFLPATARQLEMTLPVAANYRFQVLAVNSVGNSVKSDRSNEVAAR